MVNPKKLALLELLKFLGSPFNFLIIAGTVTLALLLFVFSLTAGSSSLVYNEDFSTSQQQVETNLKPKVSSFSLSQLFLPKKVLAASVEILGCSTSGASARVRVSWDPKPGYSGQYLFGEALYGFPITGAGGTPTYNTYVEFWNTENKHWSFVVYTGTYGVDLRAWDSGDFWTPDCPNPSPTPTPTPPMPTPPPPTPTLTPTPPPPSPPPSQLDLNVVNFRLSKNTLLPGESFQAIFTVANIGQVQVNSRVALYQRSSSRPSCNQTAGKVVDYNLNLLPDQNANFDPVITAPTTPGNYTAWVFVDWTCGINETSEQNNWAGVPYIVSQTPYCNAYIGGLKFNDRNGNGQRDANDEGLPGFNFSLIKDGSVIVNTVSGNDGRFSFGLRPCGTYTIREAPRSNWQPTTPTSITQYFGAATVLFGNKLIPPPPTACDDVDGNGAINMQDVVAVLAHMPPASYDSRYDINKDQKVDITDVYLVLAEVGRICRSAPITDPNLGLPQFQCQEGLVKATLSWYPPPSIVVSSYIIQISTSLNFDDPRTTRTYSLPGNVTSHTVYPLTPQARYYWRVIARTADGRQSPGTNIGQFITIPCQQTIPSPIPTGPINFPSPPPLSLQITPSLPSLPQLPSEGIPSPPLYTYPQLPSYPQYPSYQYPSTGGLPQIPGVPPPPPGTLPGVQTSDSFPPNVQILAPQEKARVSGEVGIQIYATDNVGVSSVEIYVNDQLRTTLAKPPYTWIWNVDQEPEIKNAKVPFYCHFLFGLCRTSFVISVKAYDAAGHMSADSVLVYRSQ